VHAVRQDERQGVARERPFDVADVLNGVTAQVDLDLKILMAVRAGFRTSRRFIADVKVSALAALLHAIGGDTISGVAARVIGCVHGRHLLLVFAERQGFYGEILYLLGLCMMTQACVVCGNAGNWFALMSKISL
jgi:hypothetical protein